MSTVLCPHCGTPNDAQARFCPGAARKLRNGSRCCGAVRNLPTLLCASPYKRPFFAHRVALT